jgi:glutamyl/glutaminyl-tRNA synthetase
MSSKITINKSTAYVIGAVVVLALVSTYLGTAYFVGKQSNQTVKQTDNSVDEKSLSKYENSDLENKDTLSNIISALPGGKNIDNIEPHTEKKPYGLRLHGTSDLTAKEIETISEQLLKLVRDCEWVEINSEQFHAKTTKEGLQEFSVVN